MTSRYFGFWISMAVGAHPNPKSKIRNPRLAVRDDPNLDLRRGRGLRDLDGQCRGVEVGVWLAIDPDLADLDAALRQNIRRHAQNVILESVRLRLEVEVHRLLLDQQIGVGRGQVA